MGNSKNSLKFSNGNYDKYKAFLFLSHDEHIVHNYFIYPPCQHVSRVVLSLLFHDPCSYFTHNKHKIKKRFHK